MKAVDVLREQFRDQLISELEKVNAFYFKTVHDLSDRFDVLMESVEGTNATVGVEELRSFAHRKRKNTVAQMVENFESFVAKETSLAPVESNTSNHSARIFDAAADHESGELVPDDNLRTHIRAADSIQRALGDLSRSIKLLHNFSIMNYIGFVKICKKYDKACSRFNGKTKDVIKEANICNDSREVEELDTRVERAYASWFCDDDRREARAQLLHKVNDGLSMDWSQLRLGYRLGMCFILLLWVCWDCVWGLVNNGHSTIGGRNAFPVFRACGGLLMLHWFWGLSVFVWTRNRVNYIFLFDLNPETVNSARSIFDDVVDETLVFLVLMLLYYKAGANSIPNWIPAGYFPALLVLYTLFCLIFPLKTRLPMWRTIFEVITSPLTSPTFFSSYVADVFTSMIKVFQDMAWTVCFIFSLDFLQLEDISRSTGHMWQHTLWYKNFLIPLICLLPLWIRFNQCLRKYLDTGKRFPNLANAFKYAMSQTVTLFGAFHPLYQMHRPPERGTVNWFQLGWLGLFVSSSLYSFVWDVFSDWGLGSLEHGFLAGRLMYGHRYYYYLAIVVDIVLRFMWVLTLVPPQSGASFEFPQYLAAVSMLLELMRRTMWGFFRLENEHRIRTDAKHSFVPLHFDTGHQHKYNQGKEHVGFRVLLEVGLVAIVLIVVSIASVIAAQRATRDYSAGGH